MLLYTEPVVGFEKGLVMISGFNYLISSNSEKRISGRVSLPSV